MKNLGTSSSVDKIKERLSVEEVISSYIKLEKAGANLKAKCPFHNEKTPSFFVSPNRGSYYCFGCGAKGDIFTFVEEFEGLDFKGALKILATRAGVVLEKFDQQAESEKEKLYRIMEEATRFFSDNLKKNQKVIQYLKNRGLSDASIYEFKIGFIEDNWRDLFVYLKEKGFEDFLIEKAGLIKKNEKSTTIDYYDRFRNRIMFPISDSSGRIIAFSGRLFEDDGKSAKYLNSPETPIFSKSATMYGLDKAKDSIRKNNFSILVEGQFDLVLSHQAGFRNTVATSGTALTDSVFSKENIVSSLGLIRRISSNLVLAFDADKAGIGASERASKIALSLGMDVKAAIMPEGTDPADLISKSGPEVWKKAIRESKHIIEFLLLKLLDKKQKDPRYLGREIKEKILPYVASLDSAIEKAHFLKKISEVSGISESALEDDMGKINKDPEYSKNEINNTEMLENKIFRKDHIKRRLLGIFYWQKSVPNKILDPETILEELADIFDKEKESILKDSENEKEDLIFEAEFFYGEISNLKEEIQELISNLKEEFLKERLTEKIKELHLVETKGEKADKLLNEINEISKKIEEIKKCRIKS